MRVTLLGLFLMAATLLAEPTQSDRYKYGPMVSAAKLWNMVRYLHPRVTGDSSAWDAALIAAIPKVESAHSDEELASALDDMLKTLHDPCTRIALGVPGAGVSVQSFDSDTMVIHAGNGELSGSMGAGLMLKMGIPQTNNLVWDLRGSRLPFLLVPRPDIHHLTLYGLGWAARQHSGYAPQEGTGQRYYTSSLQIVRPQADAAKKATSSRRQVYLIDKDSAVPVQAILDQINGHTDIISEDPPRDLQAGVTEVVNLLGRVVAEVRVAELYYSDGTTEFAPSRVVLNRGQEAVKAAFNSIQSGAWGMPGARPKFEPSSPAFRDMPYAEQAYPSREMRILGAIRTWGILHYFNPNVSILGDKWDDVLVELLPKFSDAKNALEYHLAIAEMAARTADTSCFARSAELGAIFGTAAPPFEVRFIEKQPVICRVFRPCSAQPGDVIVRIDGEPVKDRIDKVSRYFAAPAPAALESQIGHFLLTGAGSGTLKLTVRGKDNSERNIEVPINATNQKTLYGHRSAEGVRMISEKIGYADLERVAATEVDAMFEKLQQVPAIIFDLRGYPRDVGLAIAARLGNRNQPVGAEFQLNVVGAGASDSHISVMQTEVRIPRATKPRYTGKTVALIDDLSNSAAGETAMYFKAANDTVLMGLTAFPTFPGYATVFDVPGGVKVYFSGQRARWPDGTVLRQGGVQPDIEVPISLAGIRAGRDEVLDQAIEYLSK